MKIPIASRVIGRESQIVIYLVLRAWSGN